MDISTPLDNNDYREINDLLARYGERKQLIHDRLKEFRRIGRGSDERIFEELCFCLLTPQSRARVCDVAIRNLAASGILMIGNRHDIKKHLKGVRFHEGKSKWIVAARKRFVRDGVWQLKATLTKLRNDAEARDWLEANIMGMGYKEAGHFLRNIGRGKELAILDRHIMKNLQRYGVIDKLPETLSKKEYLRIETLMKDFADKIGIPLEDLDLLFWSMETGEIFK